jgi:hypothetical protein
MGLTNKAIVGMTNVVQEGMMALVERASKKYPEWGDTDSGRTIIAEWALRDWIGVRKWCRCPIESAGQAVKVMHRIASTARSNPGQSVRPKATVTLPSHQNHRYFSSLERMACKAA